MPGERPSFRTRPAAGGANRHLPAMLAFAAVVAAVLLGRALWEPRVPDGTVIEVTGEVPRPGHHVLAEPTIAEAVRAAGGDATALPDTPLHAGDRVVVGPDGVHVAPAGDPLLVALPVDVNSADVTALAAVPGIGKARAEAIVADREANGAYRDVDDLERVRGIGPDTIAELAPFLVATGYEPPPPSESAPPIDVNTATASELEALPGIGPVTAARIVVDREDKGPYADLDALVRVPGIGDKTVDRLRPYAVAR